MASLPRAQRLIPAIIDNYAAHQPDRVFAAMPVDDHDLAKGYKDYTYKQLARAVDAASHWLDQVLGKSNGSFETFIYVGARDLRYAIMIIAAAKIGRTVLLPSLFASMESHIFLATKTNTQHILYSHELEHLAQDIHANLTQAPCILVPELQEWLNDGQKSISHYPYTQTFKEVHQNPVFIVHTSGTTGLPKPVVYTHGHLATVDHYYDVPPLDGRGGSLGRLRKGRTYNSLPSFHLAGIFGTLLSVVFTDVIAVMGPASAAPTPEIAEQVLEQSSATAAFFSPFLLELLGREPRTMAKLKGLQYIMFAGAPLATPVGDELANSPGLTLINGIGNTEGGIWQTMSPDAEDWQWFIFHPSMGFVLEPQEPEKGSACEMWELVAHHTPEAEKFHNLWRTFPGEKVVHTKDLFSPHPTKPGLWRYRCRLDDLILLTGEIKLYCRAIEEAVGDHPAVKGVLVGGDRRSHPFMLLEIADDKATDPQAALDDIWETVEKENARNAPSARIRRDMTLVMTPDRPLVRTPKGSVERRMTFAAYEDKINDMYGGPIGEEAIKRKDSAKDMQQGQEQFVPGTEDIDRAGL